MRYGVFHPSLFYTELRLKLMSYQSYPKSSITRRQDCYKKACHTPTSNILDYEILYWLDSEDIYWIESESISQA